MDHIAEQIADKLARPHTVVVTESLCLEIKRIKTYIYGKEEITKRRKHSKKSPKNSAEIFVKRHKHFKISQKIAHNLSK